MSIFVIKIFISKIVALPTERIRVNLFMSGSMLEGWMLLSMSYQIILFV